MNIVSMLATVIALIFTGSVFKRYLERGGNHLLFWAIGALLYALASYAETALGQSFSAFNIKTYYIAGAMLTAAWLGQGTVFLLVRKGNFAKYSAAVLIVVSAYAIYAIGTAEITSAAVSYDPSLPVAGQYKEILTRSGIVVVFTILLNIYGTITLVGGAIYSAFLFWRKQILVNRLYGNVLIAAGALMSASGGTFVIAGVVDWHSLALLLGVIFMFWGYMLAIKVDPEEQEA